MHTNVPAILKTCIKIKPELILLDHEMQMLLDYLVYYVHVLYCSFADLQIKLTYIHVHSTACTLYFPSCKLADLSGVVLYI